MPAACFDCANSQCVCVSSANTASVSGAPEIGSISTSALASSITVALSPGNATGPCTYTTTATPSNVSAASPVTVTSVSPAVLTGLVPLQLYSVSATCSGPNGTSPRPSSKSVYVPQLRCVGATLQLAFVLSRTLIS